MRSRKTKDIEKALTTKGFEKISSKRKDHHQYYSLHINGKKTHIYTFLSHGAKEYPPTLMGKIKLQLRFVDSKDAEDFFDCPLTKEGYVDLLRKSGAIK